MGNHTDSWPLGDTLVRTDFVQLIWGDLQVEPADVKLVVEKWLVLLRLTAGCFLPIVRTSLETGIKLALFEPQLL